MLERNWRIGLLVFIVIALAASASAQTLNYALPSAPAGSEFSPYHQALANAADTALANLALDAELTAQAARIATIGTNGPDATLLRNFAQQYWNGDEEAVHRAVRNVIQLTPLLTPTLREEGIPNEVLALVLIESAGRPTALSPRGARGIWQFMPDTARRYGLTVNGETDERLDPEKSTRAAARYLRDLYTQFGDWSLALAAYNAGEKFVQNAITRAGSADFVLLDEKRLLPAETRTYVPAVFAASALLTGSPRFGTSHSQGNRRSLVLYANSGAGGGN